MADHALLQPDRSRLLSAQKASPLRRASKLATVRPAAQRFRKTFARVPSASTKPVLDSRLRRLRSWTGYSLAPLAVAIATGFLYEFQRFISRSENNLPVRPYGIGYIAVIAVLSLFYGWEVGLFTLGLSMFALIYFLREPAFSLMVTQPRDWGELFFLLFVGGVVTFGVDALRRNRTLARDAAETRGDLEATRVRLQESEYRRSVFNREVLLAVTGGRLMLCDESELMELVSGDPALTMELNDYGDVPTFRHALQQILTEHHLSAVIRADDLILSTTEATANALKHGSRGSVRVWLEPEIVTVIISDNGPGIQPLNMARAVFEQGFSTRASLGMGFTLMLQCVDLMGLNTSPSGTNLLLRVGKAVELSVADDLLSRYPSI